MPLNRALRQARTLLCAGMLGLTAGGAGAADITVFAAASLKTALDEVIQAWTDATGHRARVSLAGSSALARQIQQGAPADVFISANTDWMDRLSADGWVLPDTRIDLLGNALVLIAPAASDAPAVAVAADLDLPALLNGGRLAMALVDAVPAGIYGKAALEHLGLWSAIAPQVAQADNVRAALALVALGEAPLGIVYATDATADARVRTLATFPPDTHAPIVYPAAAVAPGTNPLSLAFLGFLDGETARAAFTRHGFVALQN
jgi:molybdate transport system substrate-binding protein